MWQLLFFFFSNNTMIPLMVFIFSPFMTWIICCMCLLFLLNHKGLWKCHNIESNKTWITPKSYVQFIMPMNIRFPIQRILCAPHNFTFWPVMSADWCTISEKTVNFMWLFNELFHFPHMIMNQCEWIAHINITNRKQCFYSLCS